MNKYLPILVSFWLCTGIIVSGSSQQLASGLQVFNGPNQQNLSGLKDFIIYRNNPDTILSEGYFDTYWKITKEQEAELTNISGVL